MFDTNLFRYVLEFEDITRRDFNIVGQNALDLYGLQKFDLNILDGFVITNEAFKDFLVTAHIISKLSLLLTTSRSPESLIKASEIITNTIKQAPLSKNLSDDFKTHFQLLNKKDKDLEIVIELSLNNQLKGIHNELKSRRYFEIHSYKDFVEAIREMWALLYTPELLKKRLISNSDIDYIALVVKKLVPVEISGKIVYEHKKDITHIYAEYGDFDLDLKYPDEYIYDNSQKKIIEKIITRQDTMILKQNSRLIKADVSREWKEKPRLSDHQIEKICENLQSFNKNNKNSYEIIYGYHNGVMKVFSYFEISFSNKYLEKDGINEEEISFLEEFNKIIDIHHPLSTMEVEKNISTPKSKFLSRLNLDLKLRDRRINEKILAQTKYINYKLIIAGEAHVNQGYAGVFIDFDNYYNIQLKSLSQGGIYDFFRNVKSEIARVSLTFKDSELLCKLSELRDEEGKISQRKIQIFSLEFLALKKLIEDFEYTNIRIVLPSVSSVHELEYLYKLIASIDNNSAENTIQLFLSTSSPSLMMQLQEVDLNKYNFEKIVIDYHAFVSNYLGKKESQIEELKHVNQYLEPLLKEDKKRFIFSLSNKTVYKKAIIELNPSSVIFNSIA